MRNRLWARITLAIFCLGLLLMMASMPGRADVPISIGGISFNGTLAGVKPGKVLVNTSYGLATIPSGAAMYNVGGTTMNFYGLQQVAPGTALGVNLSTSDATLQTILGGLATILLGQNGGIISLPIPVIPVTTQKKTKVYVRLRNGNVVFVPLNAALNMQRAQGATILTAVPAGTVIVPYPGRPYNTGHGQGQGHRSGH